MNQNATSDRGDKRALLVWEFGAGRTHVANLLGVAGHLRAAGVSCVAALYDTRFAAEFAALDIPVVQNFIWPARRRAAPPWKERSVQTFGDALANLGFADVEAVGAALGHYDGLISLIQPDIVLCENAPGAALAYRGRLPVIALGNGPSLPPINGSQLPPYEGHTDSPSWPEDLLCDRINQALRLAGREPLTGLSDLFRLDGVFPFGPLEFDLYAKHRTGKMLPAFAPDLERPVSLGRGDEIFVYLQPFVQGSAQILAGLQAIERPMRVYIPDLVAAERQKYLAAATVEERAVRPRDILRRSRCVLHHGGNQLSSICLAAGLPQIILAKELDNEMAGRFVRDRGLGTARHVTQATAEWIVAAARRAYDDPAVKERCERAAPQFAAWFDVDPTRVVADAALELVGLVA